MYNGYMVYIFLAMICYATALLLIAVASRNANSSLVSLIVNTVSVIIPLGVVLPIFNSKLLHSSKYGIILAVLAGVAIAIFGLAIAKSYSSDKVAIITPLVFGGAIFISSIASFFFLKEKVTPFQTIGLILLGAGLLFVIYAKATGK